MSFPIVDVGRNSRNDEMTIWPKRFRGGAEIISIRRPGAVRPMRVVVVRLRRKSQKPAAHVLFSRSAA